MVAMTSFMGFVMSVFLWIMPFTHSYPAPLAALPSLVLPLAAVYYLALFDSTMRRGNILFDEISDELQFYLLGERTYTAGPLPVNSARPDLNVRVSLRNYVNATNLPLFSGRAGITVYFFLNLLTVFISILPTRIFQ